MALRACSPLGRSDTNASLFPAAFSRLSRARTPSASSTLVRSRPPADRPSQTERIDADGRSSVTQRPGGWEGGDSLAPSLSLACSSLRGKKGGHKLLVHAANSARKRAARFAQLAAGNVLGDSGTEHGHDDRDDSGLLSPALPSTITVATFAPPPVPRNLLHHHRRASSLFFSSPLPLTYSRTLPLASPPASAFTTPLSLFAFPPLS